MAKRTSSRPSPRQRFEAELRELLDSPAEDGAVLARLEELAANPQFHQLAHLWGPALYRRNRAAFRPFLLSRLSHFGWGPVAWKGETAQALDAWLQAADEADDVELFPLLYRWKLGGSWGPGLFKRWYADLLAAFRAAATPGERARALQKYDQQWQLDEATALALYEADPAVAADFILRHARAGWGWTAGKRWDRLLALARERGDDAFYFPLYRRQVTLKQWKDDALNLAKRVADPGELVAELERRHPEGQFVSFADVFYHLAARRQRDVVPYLLNRLRGRGVAGGRAQWGKLIKLAADRGWLDLWAALVRATSTPEDFNKAVQELLDSRLDDEEKFRRLILLPGSAGEWSWGRRGFQQVHRLNDVTATALYAKFPDLVHGPFRMHLLLEQWRVTGYAKLLAAALRQDDAALVDALAAVTVTRAQSPWGQDKGLAAFAERLAGVYRKLLKSPGEFARRAAHVLGLLPAEAVGRNYRQLVQTNALARLLFEEARDAYLEAPAVFRDLLEASAGHVQALALRALARDDDRARASAAENLDLLQAALFRPLHRRTRCWAFRALFHAATTPANARLVHDRARQALDLPDKHYPKNRLIGLLGRLLHRWPELRSPREAPVVYGATP
jgi:hypothetical protein